MSQQTHEAPISERPSQANSTTIITKTREAMAFDALCVGLKRAGLAADGERWSSYEIYKIVLGNCMDALREAGLLSRTIDEVVREIEPGTDVQICTWVHDKLGAKRPYAKALDIAEAVLAELGGKIESTDHGSIHVCWNGPYGYPRCIIFYNDYEEGED